MAAFFPLQATPVQQATAAQATQDSVAADTLAAQADTTAAATDTTDTFVKLSREVGELGQNLAQGELREVVEQIFGTGMDLTFRLVPLLLKATFVALLVYLLYRGIRTVLKRILDHSKVDPGLRSLLLRSFQVVGYTFILLMVLGAFNINVTALLAGFSIIGFALGFAAKDTLENFISGITILMDKPFSVGDSLEIDGTYGVVEEITLRSTRLRTLNNAGVVMPNTQMINQKVINHSMFGFIRVEVPFGIAYKEYAQEAREVVLKLCEGDMRLDPNLPSNVVVTALNDSSVDMALRLYLLHPQQEIPMCLEYTEKIREALREADIEIPFPHLQLYIDEAKGLEGLAESKT